MHGRKKDGTASKILKIQQDLGICPGRVMTTSEVILQGFALALGRSGLLLQTGWLWRWPVERP